jgi:hypothetical protein
MFRQTGDSLIFDENGLLQKGLLIRLLVLPNDIAGIEENLRWIKAELSPRTAISLMAQYYATNKAATDERYILLSRRISEREWYEAFRFGRFGNRKRALCRNTNRLRIITDAFYRCGKPLRIFGISSFNFRTLIKSFVCFICER